MNKELEIFARQNLKEGLGECTPEQQHFFKRMYSHKDLDKPINDVVDSMPKDKLSWAMEQVKRTVADNRKKRAQIEEGAFDFLRII